MNELWLLIALYWLIGLAGTLAWHTLIEQRKISDPDPVLNLTAAAVVAWVMPPLLVLAVFVFARPVLHGENLLVLLRSAIEE